MIKRLLIMLVALVLVSGGLFGWKYYQARQQAALASMPPPPVTVSSAEVEVETWRPSLDSVGNTVAIHGVYVSNEIEGIVETVLFESGETVVKGKPLVQLDDRVDLAQLQGLIAERSLALVRFRRAETLLKDKTISRSDYDEAEADLANARAQVITKQAEINKKKIRAPFSGVLGIREVNIGQYLAAGSNIVSLQALEPIYIDYSLPERYLSDIAPGQSVTATVHAYPDVQYMGRIKTIEQRVDVGTRSIRIRSVFENSDQKLRPGMFAEIETIMPHERRVLTLPHTAITFNPYGDSVFIIEQKVEQKDEEKIVEKAEQKVEKKPGEPTEPPQTEEQIGQAPQLVVKSRQVQTGEVRGERIEITEGLQAGQRVVRTGQLKLRNGMRVQIDNSAALQAQITER